MDDRQRDDAAADERDRAANLRDIVASGFDGHYHQFEQGFEAAAMDAQSMAELRQLVAGVVGRSREARQRAAIDRARAADDRMAASYDRERARRDRHLAGLDDLTGAMRRGPGLKLIVTELERAFRERSPLALAYVDVDGLKAINDTQGHQAGDRVLRTVATTLRDRLRVYDQVVRVGGDEFVCALPGLSADEARKRLLELAQELSQEHAVTISAGVAAPREGEGADAAIARADFDLLHTRTRERAAS